MQSGFSYLRIILFEELRSMFPELYGVCVCMHACERVCVHNIITADTRV